METGESAANLIHASLVSAPFEIGVQEAIHNLFGEGGIHEPGRQT